MLAITKRDLMELITYISSIFLMTLVLFVFLYKRATRGRNAITSKFTGEIDLQDYTDEMNDKIILALKNSGFKKINYDITEKKFYAKTKLNLSSWTENISLQINQLENEYKLSFLSICAMPTQIYDWGKNRRNFKKFIIEFKKL